MKVIDLNRSECLEVLNRATVGRISCSVHDQPYVVPFNFEFDGSNYLYAFSAVGQAIRWMRENPLVCVEIEEIDESGNWTTIVMPGRYEELSDTAELIDERNIAHELLSQRPMWWRPAYIREKEDKNGPEMPVYFRILIRSMSGYRVVSDGPAVPVPGSHPLVSEKNWLRGLF